MIFYKFSFFFFLSFILSIPSFCQRDCIQNLEDLGAPVKVDTFRIIDPETYEETLALEKRYLPMDVVYQHQIQSVSIEDNTNDNHIFRSLKMQFKDQLNEYDAIEIRKDIVIHYLRIDDCLKILKVKERL